jgi:hypothetical protein
MQMELYVFLITTLVRAAAAMVIVFNCFYREATYPLFSAVDHAAQRALLLIKKIKFYRRSKTEKVLVFLRKIKSSMPFTEGKNNCPAINKSVENERAIISN